MTLQTPAEALPAQALRSRLVTATTFDSGNDEVDDNPNLWPQGQFGSVLTDIRTVVVHGTSGWPTRAKRDTWVGNYLGKKGAHHGGVGPQLYVSGDGTTFQIISPNRLTWHATYLNHSSIGVETGNLDYGDGSREEMKDGKKKSVQVKGLSAPEHHAATWPASGWEALSDDEEDIPGAKLYGIFVNQEPTFAFWTLSNTDGFAGSGEADRPVMLYTEAQYRAWALLARYLAEAWLIPRNFPLYPGAQRSKSTTDGQLYRELVNADPMRDMHIRTQLVPAGVTEEIFVSNDKKTGFLHVYPTHVHGKENKLWTSFFSSYRGFHGHGFSGATGGGDHDCPGPRFDWQRFARDVWDWWWFPFDLLQFYVQGIALLDAVVTSEVRRLDGHGDRKLREHYYDAQPELYYHATTSGFFAVGQEEPHAWSASAIGTNLGAATSAKAAARYWGAWHGGMHFDLGTATPVYAAAAGQVVAVRYPPVDAAHEAPSSARFVLLRHEVYHHRATGDRIDYDQTEPTIVHTLYMHLGVPRAIDFDAPARDNPTWLNRLLVRKKELDLCIAFHDRKVAEQAEWKHQKPHHGKDPATGFASLPQAWAAERTAITTILTDLRAGKVAVFPEGKTSVRASLGDLLGIAGPMRAGQSGIHFEVFSRELVGTDFLPQDVDPEGAFYEKAPAAVTDFIEAHVDGGVPAYRRMARDDKTTLFQRLAFRFRSEWSLVEADFPQGEWEAAKRSMWWQDVQSAQPATTPDAAKLPADAKVWHYHPLGFMACLNAITWKSEWPKYRIKIPQVGPDGNVVTGPHHKVAEVAAPAPLRPPPRL